jgi:hypothetical protein
MSDLATKLAAALLLKRGEIAVSDIEALPLVEDEQQAMQIADRLAEMFSTYRQQRRIHSDGHGTGYEDIIALYPSARPRIDHPDHPYYVQMDWHPQAGGIFAASELEPVEPMAQPPDRDATVER